ncbi:MAG: response regulator [Pseudomonadales bacterium]
MIHNKSQALTDATIMMVDDEPLEMEVIQIFLQRLGYHRFITIEEAPMAMSTIMKYRPDIVLLDLLMPDISGFDLLGSIRANDELGGLPVIVLTSSSEADTKQKVMQLGATDFLAKPVDASELALRLRNTLAASAYTPHST